MQFLFNITKIVTVLFFFISLSSFSKEQLIPKSFQAQFSKTYKSIRNALKQEFGKIEYQYPGKLRLKLIKPEESEYVSNGKTSWLYKPPFIEGESGEVRIQDVKHIRLAHFFDLLKEEVKDNKIYKVTKRKDQLLFIFTSKGTKEYALHKMKLIFKDGKGISNFSYLKEMDITQNDGKDIKFLLSKVISNIGFKNNYFNFQIPPKTNVINYKSKNL